jgi:hypothetical protein
MASRSEGLKVFVRVRPPIYKEVKKETALHINGGQHITLAADNKEVRCSYDHVFNEVTEQEEIFEQLEPLLVDVLSGINACIFAYGQTSAGKSYTMICPNGGQDVLSCPKDDWGIIPRSSEFLLGYLNEKAVEGLLTYEVKASFLQIYNENLYDLLRDSGSMIDTQQVRRDGDELRIRELPAKFKNRNNGRGDSEHMEVFVSGLSEYRVQTSEDILRIIAVGTNNRMTRSTDFNASSSRSHAVLQLTFEIESQLPSGQTIINRSKLNLVDLAGSEKIPFSEGLNNDKHIRELTSINKSLSALGNVIAALSAGGRRSHIPYRDSKLTRILQDSLSGNTRTVLIACVAPTVLHTAESLSTLQFADRAKSVMLTVKANQLVDDKFQLVKANNEIARLKTLLSRALKQLETKKAGGGGGGGEEDGGGAMYDEMERLRQQNEELKKDVKQLRASNKSLTANAANSKSNKTPKIGNNNPSLVGTDNNNNFALPRLKKSMRRPDNNNNNNNNNNNGGNDAVSLVTPAPKRSSNQQGSKAAGSGSEPKQKKGSKQQQQRSKTVPPKQMSEQHAAAYRMAYGNNGADDDANTVDSDDSYQQASPPKNHKHHKQGGANKKTKEHSSMYK